MFAGFGHAEIGSGPESQHLSVVVVAEPGFVAMPGSSPPALPVGRISSGPRHPVPPQCQNAELVQFRSFVRPNVARLSGDPSTVDLGAVFPTPLVDPMLARYRELTPSARTQHKSKQTIRFHPGGLAQSGAPGAMLRHLTWAGQIRPDLCDVGRWRPEVDHRWPKPTEVWTNAANRSLAMRGGGGGGRRVERCDALWKWFSDGPSRSFRVGIATRMRQWLRFSAVEPESLLLCVGPAVFGVSWPPSLLPRCTSMCLDRGGIRSIGRRS